MQWVRKIVQCQNLKLVLNLYIFQANNHKMSEGVKVVGEHCLCESDF